MTSKPLLQHLRDADKEQAAQADLWRTSYMALFGQAADEIERLQRMVKEHGDQIVAQVNEIDRLQAALHRMAFATSGIERHWQDFALRAIGAADETKANWKGDWLTNPAYWDLCDKHETTFPMGDYCPKCKAEKT